MDDFITKNTLATIRTNIETKKAVLTLYREGKAIYKKEYKTFSIAKRIETLYCKYCFVPGNK